MWPTSHVTYLTMSDLSYLYPSKCQTPLLYLYVYKVEKEVSPLKKGYQNDNTNN